MTDKKTRKIRIVTLDARKRSKRAGGKCETDSTNCPECRAQCPFNAQGGKSRKKQKLAKSGKKSHHTFFKISPKRK